MSTLERFLQTKPSDLTSSIRDLRLHILNEGISDGELRSRVWSILLGVRPLDTDAYLQLVERGASPAYQKIRHDTFRTLASDPLFKNKVSELSLIRVLNAYAWDVNENYVQGMNILAAPFLYVCRSEVQAFALYSEWITHHVPSYVQPNLGGVHAGVKLIDCILKKLDTKLYLYLKTKGLSAELYAFPCMSCIVQSNRSCHDIIRLHPAASGGAHYMGLLGRVRCSYEHSLHHCTTHHDA